MKRLLLNIILVVTFYWCIEPFEFETETFESVLVIQASLTNENKQHQVFLSRAIRFEDSIAVPEQNAQVVIRVDAQ